MSDGCARYTFAAGHGIEIQVAQEIEAEGGERDVVIVEREGSGKGTRGRLMDARDTRQPHVVFAPGGEGEIHGWSTAEGGNGLVAGADEEVEGPRVEAAAKGISGGTGIFKKVLIVRIQPAPIITPTPSAAGPGAGPLVPFTPKRARHTKSAGGKGSGGVGEACTAGIGPPAQSGVGLAPADGQGARRPETSTAVEEPVVWVENKGAEGVAAVAVRGNPAGSALRWGRQREGSCWKGQCRRRQWPPRRACAPRYAGVEGIVGGRKPPAAKDNVAVRRAPPRLSARRTAGPWFMLRTQWK